MARNRVIYQSEGLFVSHKASSTGGTGIDGTPDVLQLERVQSANFSYTINRQDINQFGDLARIDSVIMDAPTVTTDFSYYLTDGFNERVLGFFVKTGGGNRNTDSQFASGQMIGSDGKNVFILTGPEGKDLNNAPTGTNHSCIGIGNCYLSDYTVDLAVGSIPTVSVSMEGANVRSDNTTAGGNFVNSPAVNQENGVPLDTVIKLPTPGGGASTIKALRPGDVSVALTNINGETIADLSAGENGAHVQSVSINMPLSRSPLQRLGSRFPFAREVDFPINVSMSVSALVNEETDMNLANTLTSGVQNATVTLAKKGSAGATGAPAIVYTLKGAKIDSESMSSSIGSNKTVDLTLSAQVGGIDDAAAGLFVVGAGTSGAFELFA